MTTWLASGSAIDLTTLASTASLNTHAIASSGVHGAGTATIATTANITTHGALTASVHGAGTGGFFSPLLATLTAQFDKTTDTALANVTGLALTLAGTATYILEAILFVSATALGGHKYSLDGTVTATNIKYQVNSLSDVSNLYVINSRLTALAGTTGQTGATEVYTEIMGTIVTNAAGTINVQFAQQVASGTSSVLTQSSFKALKV